METHIRSQTLDLNPQAASPKDIRAQTVIVIVPAPGRDMGADTRAQTVIVIVPAPGRDMGADAIMLRLVPAPLTDMGADATMLRLVTATVTCMGGFTIAHTITRIMARKLALLSTL